MRISPLCVAVSRKALAAFALTGGVFAGATGAAQAQETRVLKAPAPYIAVSAAASSEAQPDRALLRIGVQTERPGAQEAASANAAAAAETLARLKALGVDAKDISTAQLTLAPVFPVEPGARAAGKALAPAGYRAVNIVVAVVRDIDRVGVIAAKLSESGANRIDGIEFEVSDHDRRLDELRGKAAAESRRLAGLYAAGIGMKVGALISLEPEPTGGPRPMAMKAARMAADSAPVMPVEPGVQTIEARVSAVWSLVSE